MCLKYKVNPNIVYERIDDEIFLLSLANGDYYQLSFTASKICLLFPTRKRATLRPAIAAIRRPLQTTFFAMHNGFLTLLQHLLQ